MGDPVEPAYRGRRLAARNVVAVDSDGRDQDDGSRRWLAFPFVAWGLWRSLQAVVVVVVGGDLADDAFRFDGGWFLSILSDGYTITDRSFASQQNPAFFPGLVWVTEPISWLIGDRPAGLVVANLTGLAAFVGVFVALRATTNERAARLAIVGLAAWPASLVLSAFYSEGLFLAVTALAIWAERSRHRAISVTAIFAAGLTRTVGAALGPAIAVGRVLHYRRLDLTSVAYASAGPAGTAVVAWSQEIQTGQATAWMRAQEAWGRGLAAPWVPIGRALDGIVDKFPHPASELSLNLAAIVVVGSALVLVTHRYRSVPDTWPMLAWGWTAWLLPLCSSVPSSQIRFALAAWPALVAIDEVPATRRGRCVLVAMVLAGGVLSVLLIRRWAHGAFIG
jgi:hypothetical protein